MDKKLIAQYGEDILSYRLRTARQKKRAQYKDFDKQLIQLHKEEDALWRQRWVLNWVPLIPPRQLGWKRFFVLRPDVAKSRHADFFAGILKKVNTCQYHPRKDFLVRKGKRRRKRYVVKQQQLKHLHRAEFARLTDAEKQFFHCEAWIEPWSRLPVAHYVFNEPSRFILQVKPNIVDKVRVRDVELETQLDAIREYLDRNDYRGRLNKVVHGHGLRWRLPDDRNPHPYKHWPIQKIIEVTSEEVYNE